jgi:hypothetical protein
MGKSAMSEHCIVLTREERLATLIVRPILPQPREGLGFIRTLFPWKGKLQAEFETPPGYHDPLMYHPLCPLGVVGDVLLGREAYTLTNANRPIYRADCSDMNGHYWPSVAADPRGVVWLTAARMPKRFIRWRRTIVALGVLRAHDLSDADARATGVFPARLYSDLERGMHGGSEYRIALHEAFNKRWGRLVRWETNPWVWWARVEPER